MGRLTNILGHINLKSVVVVLTICGSLGLAYIDKDQRDAFMTIAVTVTGGFFGAEIPNAVRRSKSDEEE